MDSHKNKFAPLLQMVVAGITVFDLEKEYIKTSLEYCRGNKQKTAKLLGVSRATVVGKIKQFEWAQYIGDCGHTPKRGPARSVYKKGCKNFVHPNILKANI